MNLFPLLQDGLARPEYALAVARVALGVFFTCSGWNKTTNMERHAAIVDTFKRDHVPAIRFNEWWVPGWELGAGAMLTVGLFSAFDAFVLAVICGVACLYEARERVNAYKPINEVDRVADYLYLPEVLYLVALLAVCFGGGGALALDRLL